MRSHGSGASVLNAQHRETSAGQVRQTKRLTHCVFSFLFHNFATVIIKGMKQVCLLVQYFTGTRKVDFLSEQTTLFTAYLIISVAPKCPYQNIAFSSFTTSQKVICYDDSFNFY